MNTLKKAMVLACLAGLLGCLNNKGDIPVVGQDWLGNDVQGYLSKKDFTTQMTSVLKQVNTAAVQSLESTPTQSSWELDTLTVGIGINISFSLINIVDLETSGRVRLAFSRNSDPLIPSQR